MIRTQIQLTESLARKLRSAAQREGVSVAEYIRRCVDRATMEAPTDRADLYARAARLVGSLQDLSGAADLSAEHDRYLEDAYR